MNLSKRTLLQLRQSGTLRSAHKAQMLYMAGDPATYLFLILEGNVKTFRMNAMGRRLFIASHNPIVALGISCLSTSQVYSAFAEANSYTKYIAIHQNQVNNLLENNLEFCRFLLLHSVSTIEDLEVRLEDSVFLGVRERLASLLLQIATRRNTLIIVGLGHRELAEMLGTHRETLTQAVTELRQIRAIQTSRLKIELLDVEQLKQIAQIY